MYFIILIIAIFFIYISDNWLALLIENYWWQSWFIYSSLYFLYHVITTLAKESQERKEYERRKTQEQREYERIKIQEQVAKMQEQAEYNQKLQQHFDYIINKYGDTQITQMIIDGTFWVGATEEQLLDAIGQPEKIDVKVLKSKTVQIWRYNKINQRSFGLSITLENGVVVGWETK